MKRDRLFAVLLSSLTLLWGNAALAETELEINDYEAPAFDSRKLESGPIQVTVSYKPFNFESQDSENSSNFHYTISYNGVVKVVADDMAIGHAHVFFKDLDGDQVPEVVVDTYSGGAHCCSSFKVYSWKRDRFLTAELGPLNSGGGIFEDLEENGQQEFLSDDNAFLYAFSSYAGSFPPSRIYRLREGQFEDVTRQYPKELRSRAQSMYEAVQESKQQGGELNGVLAGYVAQKILLGEYEAGWKFMLAHYDRQSDWGLTIYKEDQEVGKYPDFPTALKAFLIQQGYLDAQGQPR